MPMPTARFLTICLLWLAGPAMAQNPASLSGRDIMREIGSRHDMPVEYEEISMELIDSRNNKEVRTLRRFSREGADGRHRYLLTFDSPPAVKGVAVLTWVNKGKDDDQWAYLPALGSDLKRNTGGNKRAYLMGTDFTNEDLTAEDLDKFEYRRHPDQKIGAETFFVIDAYPAAADIKAETGYSLRRLYVRQDNFFVVRVDYFDRRGKFLKQQINTKLQQVSDKAWRAQKVYMINQQTKHRTVLDITARAFDPAKVPLEMFEHVYLTGQKHMQ